METQLMAGTAQVDITPPKGVELAGYPHAPRHNTGVLDPLFATCLFLDDGARPMAIVGLDTLFFSKKHIKAVTEAVRAQPGLADLQVMVCASHSHSSPWAAGRLDMDSLLAGAQQDAGYIEELRGKLAGLITAAARTAFPATLAYGQAPCGKAQGVGGNRRDPENGPCDPVVYTLAVRDGAGTVRCVLVNYALHPTVLHADNTRCSADYPGAMRRRLAEAYPHAAMVFTLGAAGDQSTRYFRTGQTCAEAERIGSALAAAAAAAVEGARAEDAPTLSVKTAAFQPPMRTLPDRAAAEARVAQCKAQYDALVAQNADYIDRQNANVTLLGAEDILGYVLMAEQGRDIELVRDELPAEIAVYSIGDIRLVCLPGEVFVDVALDIRRKAGGDKLIVATLAGGCLPGYCYTAQAAAEGGYEVDTSLMGDEAGAVMIDAAAGLLAGE